VESKRIRTLFPFLIKIEGQGSRQGRYGKDFSQKHTIDEKKKEEKKRRSFSKGKKSRSSRDLKDKR